MAKDGEIEPINNFGTYRGKSRAASSERPHGRYDGRRRDTRAPADGLARVPVAQRRLIVTGAVTDPYDPDLRIDVAINSKVDLLELERSHNRISEGAYRTGRIVQAVWERLGRVAGSNWCGASRIDPMMAQEINMIRTLDSADKIVALEDKIRGQLGALNFKLIRRVLGDRLSFAECACLVGKGGERGVAYIAWQFRAAMEDLANAMVGKGKSIPTPDDKYKAASIDMEARQAASIKAGVSEANRKAKLE